MAEFLLGIVELDDPEYPYWVADQKTNLAYGKYASREEALGGLERARARLLAEGKYDASVTSSYRTGSHGARSSGSVWRLSPLEILALAGLIAAVAIYNYSGKPYEPHPQTGSTAPQSAPTSRQAAPVDSSDQNLDPMRVPFIIDNGLPPGCYWVTESQIHCPPRLTRTRR